MEAIIDFQSIITFRMGYGADVEVMVRVGVFFDATWLILRLVRVHLPQTANKAGARKQRRSLDGVSQEDTVIDLHRPVCKEPKTPPAGSPIPFLQVGSKPVACWFESHIPPVLPRA
jgi:hypothetical protein